MRINYFRIGIILTKNGAICNKTLIKKAAVVKLADASDSKSDGSDTVSVRVRPAAPTQRAPDLRGGSLCWCRFKAQPRPIWKDGEKGEQNRAGSVQAERRTLPEGQAPTSGNT